MRWLAYTTGIVFLVGAIGGSLFAGLYVPYPWMGENVPLLRVVSVIICLVISVWRMKDMDHGAVWVLLLLVPFVNLIFALWLLFGSGTEGRNSYGPAPAPNSRAVIIVAWLLPSIVIIGIAAAIIIPAYQKDKLKTRAAEQASVPAPVPLPAPALGR